MHTQKVDPEVQAFADEIRSRAHDDALIGIEKAADRERREAAELEMARRVNQLGRVEEVRASLARHAENYASAINQAYRRLQALANDPAPEVAKAAKAVAAAHELEVSAMGLKQPPTPKGHSPFAE